MSARRRSVYGLFSPGPCRVARWRADKGLVEIGPEALGLHSQGDARRIAATILRAARMPLRCRATGGAGSRIVCYRVAARAGLCRACYDAEREKSRRKPGL